MVWERKATLRSSDALQAWKFCKLALSPSEATPVTPITTPTKKLFFSIHDHAHRSNCASYLVWVIPSLARCLAIFGLRGIFVESSWRSKRDTTLRVEGFFFVVTEACGAFPQTRSCSGRGVSKLAAASRSCGRVAYCILMADPNVYTYTYRPRQCDLRDGQERWTDVCRLLSNGKRCPYISQRLYSVYNPHASFCRCDPDAGEVENCGWVIADSRQTPPYLLPSLKRIRVEG